MKAPTKVELAFDPEQAGVVSFTSNTATIIWCCIRKQHIVDQHFDSQVFKFAKHLDKNMPNDYEVFKKMVSRTGLRVYGTDWINPTGLASFGYAEINDEFWQGVWEYIIGETELEIERTCK